MLNITRTSIKGRVNPADFRSGHLLLPGLRRRTLPWVLRGTMAVMAAIMFLPWTQNIRGRGFVTTLRPDQRPQEVQSLIDGRIERWFVREGDLVQAGDTLVLISEIKDDYFDPQLIPRTEEQIRAKQSSAGSYVEKVRAIDAQTEALRINQRLRTEQATNRVRQAELRVQTDSIEVQAALIALEIARQQLTRGEEMLKQGVESLTSTEGRRVRAQDAYAKSIAAENRLLESRNHLLNARIELNSIEAEFRDRLAKAASEKFSALSAMYDTEATVTKMQNQLMNYAVRRGMHSITAPQTGYVTRTYKAGVGETVKAGEMVLTVMPERYELAVEMYIRPIDLPLVKIGRKVRFLFDGWPAIVFSGWPNASVGTYGGEVWAIDNFISDNGYYRIIVSQDPDDRPWPQDLRVGSGADAMTLLDDVPVWYELWRQVNGFPPEYYALPQQGEQAKKEGKE